jgi:putative membrane protein
VTPPAETQPERTALAWQRTGLGMLAVAGLLAHGAVRQGEQVALVVAGVAALLGLGVLGGLAPVRYRQVRRQLATTTVPPAPGLLTVATGAAALVAVAAAVAVLTQR